MDPSTNERPSLGEAVGAHLKADQDRAAARPADASFLARLDADAALYGTPAYDAFPPAYRDRLAARALETARTAQQEPTS
ncbi:hypothetical protein [Streptomyces sp. NPDC101132]|uniref:hypothetical protein n=1 Tax=Streptomyces sp. NPDC101132 TaxID=3366110 RepID=UPI00381CE02F